MALMVGMDRIAPAAPGIVTLQRSTLRVLWRILRNPLGSLPAASFRERLVLTRNGGRLRAYVSDPALIHEALVRNAANLTKSREMRRVLGQALGDGLLTTDGASWRWQRQALAPAFQPDGLVALSGPMIAAAAVTRDRWRAQARASGGAMIVDVGQAMMRTTFAIILETMLSGADTLDAAAVETAVADYLRATPWMFVLAILDAPRWLPFPGRSRALSGSRRMRRAVRDRIATRRVPAGAPTDAGANQGEGDLVTRLLAAVDPETGRSLDDDEVADNILTFIAAGHETTAVALTWTLSLLADHPACAARLRAEFDAVTGGAPLTPGHLDAMPYARQVLSEAMRLYPPAPLIARAVTSEFSLGGIEMPVGTILFVPVYAVHRHAALWPDPERFDPERFAPDATGARHRFAFLPFGVGPRVCIGNTFALNEAVAILATIVGAFTFERLGPPPEPVMKVTLRPRHPVRLRFTPRGAG